MEEIQATNIWIPVGVTVAALVIYLLIKLGAYAYNIYVSTQVPEIKRVPAKANWDGVPKPDLTWEEVSKKVLSCITPFTLETRLTQCPTCGSKLLEYKSAFTIHEEVSMTLLVNTVRLGATHI